MINNQKDDDQMVDDTVRQFGERGATRMPKEEFEQIGKMAADTVIASARKTASDVMMAAEAAERYGKMLKEDAAIFAGEVERHAAVLQGRLMRFTTTASEIAHSFRAGSDKLVALAADVASGSTESEVAKVEEALKGVAAATAEEAPQTEEAMPAITRPVRSIPRHG